MYLSTGRKIKVDQRALFPPPGQALNGRDVLSNECQIISVGKRRDGGTRYWCLQHKADATAKYGKAASTCRAAHVPPIRAEDTLQLHIDKYKGGIALWGAVPAVYDTTELPMDRGIHVHARASVDSKKELDRTFRAVQILSDHLPEGGIVVSEIDAIYYMATSVFGHEMKLITCPYCDYAHLDRDWFSTHPHRRHLCAGCGRHFRDTEIAIGNPISGVRQACGVKTQRSKLSARKLNIKQADFSGGIQIWGSNPAFLWTSDRAEEEGIHVHAFHEGGKEPDPDETYGEVTIDGVDLDPVMVRVFMAQSALPSLKGRIRSLNCSSCARPHFSTGDLAFTPILSHSCEHCGRQFQAPGRLRKTITNPMVGVLKCLEKKAVRKPQLHDLGLMPETL